MESSLFDFHSFFKDNTFFCVMSSHYRQRQTVKKPRQSHKQIYQNICRKKIIFLFLSMKHIEGISRYQLQFSSLEDTIGQENPVRFIDAFVNTISLEKIGFTARVLKAEGRPSFDSQVFLKIYLYGYLNGIRSSRRLEKECRRNLEMQWLLEAITPNYHSIADYRLDNPKALKQLRQIVCLIFKRGYESLTELYIQLNPSLCEPPST
jgi:transposase